MSHGEEKHNSYSDDEADDLDEGLFEFGAFVHFWDEVGTCDIDEKSCRKRD